MRHLIRRVRGALVRLTLRRWPAVALGVLLVAAAVLVRQIDAWAPWIASGLSLVLGATGLAFLLGGLGGRRGDWIDPES